jgi:hypothetical protein
MDVGLGNAKFERLKIIVSGAWSSGLAGKYDIKSSGQSKPAGDDPRAQQNAKYDKRHVGS